ncbi:MAG: hypothetical protein ACKOYP_02405 [Bacteroidota bacterium]
MNRSIIVLVLFVGGIVQAAAQTDSGKTTVKYYEINAGAAYLGRSYTETGLFPGASFLWGRTDYFANGKVVDRQIGVAFPTIVTGKIGIGYGSEKGAMLVGIRPWPPTGYLQGNISTGTGTLLLTAEITSPEFGYSSIFTAGYRWNRKSN